MNKKKVSCLPCRLKKVKCNGEYPCGRCQTKDQNCVYQKPKTVGRPPKNAVINKLVLSRSSQQQQTTAKTFCREFIFENVSNTPELTPVRYLEDSRKQGLQFYANQLFTTIFSILLPTTSLPLVINNNKDSQSNSVGFFALAPKIKVFGMNQFFTMLSSDIANILARRISKLRLVYYDELAFSKYGLRYDHTESFFETPSDNSLVSNPLNSLPPQQAVRLLDCFFNIHPYSVLFSKTMLLQSYWTDTADPLLLTVIYGTTVYMSQLLDGKPLVLWEAIEKKARNPFLDYAYILLSKVSAEATPSRYQALVVLALFEVLFGYPKRGMALFALSHMLAAKLGLYDNTLPSGLNPVEKELLSATFWASFNCCIRGCIELERLPKSALVDHTLPYPPPNVKKSKAYQFDLENNNVRSFKNYGHHVEAFYTKSIISRITCKLISYLPDAYQRTSVLSSCNTIQIFANDLEEEQKNKMINENISKVLSDFKDFIKANKKNWSPSQIFACELYHSFYVISLSFLRESSSNSIHFPYNIYQNFETPQKLDLTDVDNIIKIDQLVPVSIALIEKSFNFISDSKNYYNDPDFLPKGIIVNALDAAVQILMYSYCLLKSEKVRHYIQLAKIIFSLSNVWDDWSTADMIKTVIDQFLEQHPITEEDTNESATTDNSIESSSSSQSPFPNVFYQPVENNSTHFDIESIFTQNEIMFPLLQQPSSILLPTNLSFSVSNDGFDCVDNEPFSWLQELNAEQQAAFLLQQEQEDQQVFNQLEFSAMMFDNLV